MQIHAESLHPDFMLKASLTGQVSRRKFDRHKDQLCVE
jgi:hypothetical protein